MDQHRVVALNKVDHHSGNREQDSTNKEGKPYLGKTQDPVPTKGLDGKSEYHRHL